MAKKRARLTRNCESCGDKPDTRVLYKGKRRVACNRCGTRVRLGGDFLVPWKAIADRRAKIEPKVRKMRREGKTFLEIARANKISVITARRWSGNA